MCSSDLALALDPDSVDAQAMLALTLVGRVLEQMSDSTAADIERAERLVGTALAASPRHALAHFACAQVLRAQGRHNDAIPEYEIALALDHNSVAAIAALGLTRLLAGSIEGVIPAQEQAIRLSPRDPRVPNWCWRIGMVHLLQGRPAEAINWLEQSYRQKEGVDISLIRVHPFLDPLRRDPRFEKLANQIVPLDVK